MDFHFADMKKKWHGLVFFLLFAAYCSAQYQDRHCGTDQRLTERLATQPELKAFLQNQEIALQEHIRHFTQRAGDRQLQVSIPVVVHILWQEDDQNLAEEIINVQIEELNQDFQQRNEDRVEVPQDFAASVANVGFEFCLASVDPNGQVTNGITRTATTVDCIGDIGNTKLGGKPRLFYTDLGGIDAWDTEHYLNIWVAPTCNAFLGTASFPETIPKEEDGVVIESLYFGVRSANSISFPFHLGKTTTHEVGHYFNLKHIWGERGCEVDDLVADTPQQEEEYRGCPIHPFSSCGSPDMFMNFMNYTDDECLLFFTKGQQARMLASLHQSRAGLLENLPCIPNTSAPLATITFFPNPTRDCIHLFLSGDRSATYLWYLYETSGKLVDHGRSHPQTLERINLQGLASGIYFLTTQFDGDIQTHKILVLPESF